jgi:hypothetical protein
MLHFLSIALLISMLAQTPPAEAPADLSWLAGVWATEPDARGAVTEEFWSDAKGGLMLGASRTLQGERAVFFEHLRLERRDTGWVYLASPRGQNETAFALTAHTATSATFENPEHDFPKKISYALEGDTLTATVTGERNGREGGFTLVYRRR